MSTAVSRVLACLLEKEVISRSLLLRSRVKLKGRSNGLTYVHDRYESAHVELADNNLAPFVGTSATSLRARKPEPDGPEGGGAAGRAAVDQWVEAEAQSFNPPSTALVFQLVFAPKMRLKQDPNATRDAEGRLRKVLDVYERRLGGSRFLAGRNSRSRICATSRMPTTSSPRPTRGSSSCRRGGTSRGGGRRSPAAPRGRRSLRCGAMQLHEFSFPVSLTLYLLVSVPRRENAV
uniref:glutathione transferase n=1 Tax=Ananas comosus var. bracteatus TaxID=296719 RepID=A0A6V7QD32_ANACO|nr:unnamed protein product [Ananas comosus var. bracteatus]